MIKMESTVISISILVVLIILGVVAYFMYFNGGPSSTLASTQIVQYVTPSIVQSSSVQTWTTPMALTSSEIEEQEAKKWYDQELQYNFSRPPGESKSPWESWLDTNQDKWDKWQKDKYDEWRKTYFGDKVGVDKNGCAIHPDIKFCHALGRCEYKWNCPNWSRKKDAY